MTMKLNLLGISALAIGLAFTACDDYLDITPPSQVSADVYFTTADQLGAYTIAYYKSNDAMGNRGSNLFPSFGIGGS